MLLKPLLWASLALSFAAARPAVSCSDESLDGLESTADFNKTLDARDLELVPRVVTTLRTCAVPYNPGLRAVPLPGGAAAQALRRPSFTGRRSLSEGGSGIWSRAPPAGGAAPARPASPGAEQPIALPVLPKTGGAAAGATHTTARITKALAQDHDIGIVPPVSVLQNWVVEGVQITLTAMYYPFTTNVREVQNYVMKGLEGCTAVFVYSSKGLWALHIWEDGTTKPLADKDGNPLHNPPQYPKQANPLLGIGGFMRRVNGEHEPRPIPLFKKIATELLNVDPPASVKTAGTFVSLSQLRTEKKYGNPFGNPDDTRIVILTPSAIGSKTTQKYPQHIAALQQALLAALEAPTGRLRKPTVQLYEPWHYKTGGTKSPVRGLLTLEYTPFQQITKGAAPKKEGQIRVIIEDQLAEVSPFLFQTGASPAGAAAGAAGGNTMNLPIRPAGGATPPAANTMNLPLRPAGGATPATAGGAARPAAVRPAAGAGAGAATGAGAAAPVPAGPAGPTTRSRAAAAAAAAAAAGGTGTTGTGSRGRTATSTAGNRAASRSRSGSRTRRPA